MVTVKGKKPENQKPWVLIAVATVAVATAVVYRLYMPVLHEEPQLVMLNGAKPVQPGTRTVNHDPWTGALPNKIPSQAPTFSPQTQTQLSALNEILASKNDNDPRLDTVLRHFTPEAKEALKEKYHELPVEDRNGRGTVVFLLGRELDSPQDVAFLSEVLSEKPCLSLSDCSKAAPASTEAHHDDMANVTLNYPQFVAVISMEKKLERTGSHLPPSLKDAMEQAARAAQASPVASIASHGRELENNLSSRAGG